MENILLNIEDSSYKINFPNVGEMMEIEKMKSALTDGKYLEYNFSVLKNHQYLLDVVDTISYLSVLIPELKKDLEVKDWKKLSPIKAKRLVKVYKSDFIPWYKKIFDDLNNFDEEIKSKGDEEQADRTS